MAMPMTTISMRISREFIEEIEYSRDERNSTAVLQRGF